MHWFPRATLAAMTGFGAQIFMFIPLSLINDHVLRLNNEFRAFTVAAPFWLATYLLSVLVYGRMSRIDAETRCRKCQYILKGITEPRCPECGERI